MGDVASLSLLFVAAALLVLAGMSVGRARGQPPSAFSTALLAGMTGIALGFVMYVMWVPPLLLFPVVVAGILMADWLVRGAMVPLGAFLIGAGGLWAAIQSVALVNDLSDEAVSIPGWTPFPLALSFAATILGAALIVAITRGSPEAPR
jgi:hypothetical protein